MEVENVSSATLGIKDLSFTLQRGSILGVTGAESDKLLNLFLNKSRPDHGDIRIFGLPLSTEDILIKENIGVVFSKGHFHHEFNARQIGKILSKVYTNWSEAEYLALISYFMLDSKEKTAEYSPEMQSDLALAAALSHGAQLLILEKPHLGQRVVDLLLDFVHEDVNAILLLSNDAERLTDNII